VPGDGVKVGVQPVVEIGVRLPDLLQHLHVQAQLTSHTVIHISDWSNGRISGLILLTEALNQTFLAGKNQTLTLSNTTGV
jgi:hypothetical protein